MSETFSLPDRIIDIHNHLRPDDDGLELIGLMDEVHIDVTLIMGSPREFRLRNEAMVEACHKYPDRLVGGAYYDPREGKKAIDALKHYRDEGIPVVKLFPNLGYFPDADEVRPFFEKVAELGMAVLSHCGWLGGSGEKVSRENWAAYYSHPGRFEKVIRACPDTVFIMAHMGGIAGLLESVMLTTRTPNTFVDCSPGQGLWALEHGGAITASVPPEKLMWGADGYGQKESLPRYKTALEALGYGPHLDKVFYGNARGILEGLGLVKAD